MQIRVRYAGEMAKHALKHGSFSQKREKQKNSLVCAIQKMETNLLDELLRFMNLIQTGKGKQSGEYVCGM